MYLFIHWNSLHFGGINMEINKLCDGRERETRRYCVSIVLINATYNFRHFSILFALIFHPNLNPTEYNTHKYTHRHWILCIMKQISFPIQPPSPCSFVLLLFFYFLLMVKFCVHTKKAHSFPTTTYMFSQHYVPE